jgi:hypothetical protein
LGDFHETFDPQGAGTRLASPENGVTGIHLLEMRVFYSATLQFLLVLATFDHTVILTQGIRLGKP